MQEEEMNNSTCYVQGWLKVFNPEVAYLPRCDNAGID